MRREKESLRAKLTEIESELQRIREQSQRSITAIQERFKDTVGAVLDEAGRLKLDVKGKILFETGSAILSTEGKELLDAISEEVLLNADYSDYAIRIEGHTDNTPIGGDALRNWNLSTERAIAAVKYLQEHANVSAERLAATGYAFYQPIDTAETPEAKAKNRRIEIILVPPQDFLSELLTSLPNVMQSIEAKRILSSVLYPLLFSELARFACTASSVARLMSRLVSSICSSICSFVHETETR